MNRHIDQVCDRFEVAWKKGKPPQIEVFLEEAEAGQRSTLLRELILLETAYRLRRGDRLDADEYLGRFPELDGPWIATTIELQKAQDRRQETGAGDTTVGPGAQPAGPAGNVEEKPARAEHEAAPQICCPHCHSAIQLNDKQPDEVLCPGCGGSFRIRDARVTTSGTPLRLGKFELLERVGLGAFGAVWRAKDIELDRVVALKIPHAGLTIEPEELQRFHEEARRLAQLRHPGIVTIHEVATLQGLPVIVSDFIQGVPLSDLMESRRLAFRESATLLAATAEALDYVHSRGVVHRDIKPANVMVEYHAPTPGSRPVADLAKPLLLDFGLALHEQSTVTLTQDGQIIGTPAYMSPEQAAGKGHQADRRSDVFSLGVVLYELLCGELPFRGSRLMMLNQVLFEDPWPPSRINDKVPRDLETVCLKAMSKEPGRRYSSAQEMADDLKRFLAGEPIKARPVGRLERALSWCRRYPRYSALIGTVFLLLTLLASGATISAVQINHQRWRADEQRKLAESRSQEAEEQGRRAEEHFQKTLETVDLLTRVAQEAAENTPRMEESQLRSLERARQQLTSLLEDKPRDLAVRVKLALLYERMGRIWWMNGEDVRARATLTESAQAFRQLEKDDPEEKAYYDHHWAICQNELGETYRHTRDRDKARPHYDSALAVQKDLIARAIGNPKLTRSVLARELARTENNLGLLLLEQGRFDQAEKSLNSALGRLKEVQHEPDCLATCAQVHINRGYTHLAQKKKAEAVANPDKVFVQQKAAKAGADYDEAINLFEKLKERYPSKHDYQYKLGVAYNNLGEWCWNTRQPGAGPAYENARDLFTRLAANFPRYHLYRKELAQTWNNLGIELWGQKNPSGAKRAFLKAQRLSWALAMNPGHPEYKSLAARSLNNLAFLAWTRGNLAEARRCVDGAIPLQESALAANPENPDFLMDLVEQERLLADTLVTQREPLRVPRLLVRRALAVGSDNRLPSAGQSKAMDRLAGKAVEILNRLVPELQSQGCLTLLEKGKDWQSLRGREDFEKLLAELRTNGK